MLQNTRSVQEMESLPMRNASYLYFCTVFVFNNNKKHAIKKHKEHLKNLKKT